MTCSQEHKDAAKRQGKIAAYFFERLGVCYNPSVFEQDELNTIQTQAYFEGCIRAVYSCLDKLCEGRLKADFQSEEESLAKALKKGGLDALSEEVNFINQLRNLRNDVTHSHTNKTSKGDLCMEIAIKNGRSLGDIKEVAQKALGLAERAIKEVVR